VPLTVVVTIVRTNHRRIRFTEAVQQRVRQSAGFKAKDLQSGGFERLDETISVADAHHVSHPTARITSGAELDNPRLVRRNPGILAQEFLPRRVVADEPGTVNIAAVDD